jgi:hypothetical protein
MRSSQQPEAIGATADVVWIAALSCECDGIAALGLRMLYELR